MAYKNCFLVILCFVLFQITPVWSATWDLPATDLTTAPPNAGQAVIGIDGAGNTVAAWVFDLGGGQSYVVAESKAAGANWSGTPITISINPVSTQPNDGEISPQISVNNAGQAIAVWRVRDANGSHIQANTMRALDIWEFLNGTNVSDATLGNGVTEPHVGTNAAGGGVAAWTFQIPGQQYIQASRVDSYGNWLPPTDLADHSNPAYNSLSSQIAVNAAGAAVAVWTFNDGGGNLSIQARRMSSGGVWDPVMDLAGPLANVGEPFVAINDNGEAVAAWVEGISPSGTIHASNMTSGGVWSASQLLSDPGLDSESVRVTLDSNGNAVAVWKSVNNPTTFSQTRAATQLAGQSWTPTNGEIISDPVTTATLQNSLRIDVDNSGKVVVAWVAIVLPPVPPLSFIILGTTKPFGASWDSSPTTLSGATDGIDGIGLDVNSNGAAAVDWGFNSSPNTIIQATGLGGSPVSGLSATGKQIASRFAMQTEYSNVLEWSAVGGTTIGYHIYRNGTLIAAVPSSQLEYQDQFQRKRARVTYRIAAVDNSGCEIASGTVVIN